MSSDVTTPTSQEPLSGGIPESIIEKLTPSAYEYFGDFLHHVVEPIFQGVLSSYELPSDFKFEKVDLGSKSPEFVMIRTQILGGKSEPSFLLNDFDYAYDGNCDIKASLLGVSSGIKDLIIKGRARMVLKPLQKKALPFFAGGAQFMLLDVPQIYFDMEGLAEVCDWPVIRNKIRKDLHEAIKNKFVFPHKYCIPLSSGVDPMELRAFAPTGMLAVRLNFAEGLPVKGSLIRSLVGQDKPDPYAKIILGANESVSAVVKNTTEPSWEDKPVWHEFLVESPAGQELRLELYDEDTLTKDEFLGDIFVDLEKDLLEGDSQVIVTKDLLNNEFKKTKYDIQGKLTLTLRWLPLGSYESLNHYEGPSRVVFSLFIYSCNNLVLKDTPQTWPDTYLEISFAGETRRTPTIKGTPHPNFYTGETFTVGETFMTKEAILTLKEESGETNSGALKLSLADYHRAPVHRKILPFNPESPFATITLSASVICI